MTDKQVTWKGCDAVMTLKKYACTGEENICYLRKEESYINQIILVQEKFDVTTLNESDEIGCYVRAGIIVKAGNGIYIYENNNDRSEQEENIKHLHPVISEVFRTHREKDRGTIGRCLYEIGRCIIYMRGPERWEDQHRGGEMLHKCARSREKCRKK